MSLFKSASLVITPNATKASKLYSIKPTDGSGDLSVTRATTATRVNSSGLIQSVSANVPRLDYSNGSCPSILVEPQRTNVQIQSEDFSNAVYLKIGSTITTNTTTAPDGTTTADKLVEDTSTGLHTALILAQQPTLADYTVSVFVKASGRTKFEIREGFSVGGNIKFDLTAETFTTTSPAKNGKIEKFKDGWYKCSATWPNLTGANTQILLSPLNNSNASSYTGDGTSGVFLWGTQIELGSYATSYIPTTSASVTRNADVISKTGISSLIGQTEGTIFCDVNLNSRVSFTYLALSTDLTTSSNYLGIGFLANSIAFESVVGAALQANIVFSNNSTGRFKIAAGYKANDFVLYVNGVQIGIDTSGTIPACSQLGLNAFSNAQALNYNSVQLYKTKLSNTQLAELTTI